MEKESSGRLFSLDLLRGLDMVFLTVVGPLVWAVDAGWGLPDGFLYNFTHPWEGFTPWGIIMPLFLFMYGTDCRVNRYNVDWSRDWQRTDDAHLADFGLGADVLDDYYRRGLRRFLFGGDNTKRKVPTPDGRNGNPRG